MDAGAWIGTAIAGDRRIVRLIGAGSTADVYVAQSTTGELAAVKVLHEHWAEERDVRARFLKEGKAANLIAHPGVVKILADGLIEGRVPYLVMELLDGETLEERRVRKGGKLPAKEVLWAADQILSVLAAAHAKKILHRDVKPENVFLTRDRRVKLLDFGVARLAEHADGGTSRTQVGTLLGTPAFLPPEQARGEQQGIGVQTDLWSVGATMFTLLSGRYVHEEEQLVHQLIAATSKNAPSVSAVAPHVPKNIVHLVDFALAFESKNRWPNAQSMRQAIRLAYTEWALTPLPDDLDRDEDDDQPTMHHAPSAPPPSSALTPEEFERIQRGEPRR